MEWTNGAPIPQTREKFHADEAEFRVQAPRRQKFLANQYRGMFFPKFQQSVIQIDLTRADPPGALRIRPFLFYIFF